METKEIKVGDYIRGFKYDCGEYMIYRMNDLIGEIAKVIKVEEDIIFVKFSNGKTWWYPKDQAIEHLAGSDTTYTLSDLKADCTNEYKKDNINPDHYKSKSKETIERLQDNLTQGEFKGYLKGNILKYLDRYEHKNGVEDLSKAQWYLNKLIELES
jgi:predicted Rossmann fold nucleotide-binding protein DprA/Smf involved in DNA uptake